LAHNAVRLFIAPFKQSHGLVQALASNCNLISNLLERPGLIYGYDIGFSYWLPVERLFAIDFETLKDLGHWLGTRNLVTSILLTSLKVSDSTDKSEPSSGLNCPS